MAQRVTTAIGLIAILMVLMYFGGAVLSIAAMICICFAVAEEYNAFRHAGYRTVSWPTWAGMFTSIPIVLLFGSRMIVPLICAVTLVTLICVVFRAKPELHDMMLSVVPMATIVLPGMCIIGLALVHPKALQVVLLCLLFAVPVLCDTFAFLIGSRVGGPKLCPAVSPHKTVSGAIGGMIGALLATLAVALVAAALVNPAQVRLPTWYQYLLIALVGGAASQMGDLFASMIKRHCGIKDFSNLFPGHGGMLDRLDSIFFMAIVMFVYRLLS